MEDVMAESTFYTVKYCMDHKHKYVQTSELLVHAFVSTCVPVDSQTFK